MPDTYSLISENRGGIDILSLVQGDSHRADIAPALGNHCFSFTGQGPILEPVPLETYLKKPTSYGIPILFPYPGRIRDGAFSFGNRRFTVSPTRHGYVRDRAWQMTAMHSDDNGVSITCQFNSADYPELLPQYPFPFRLEVTYTLSDGVLTHKATAYNDGSEPMPCGYGIHPYFHRPGNAKLRLPANKRFDVVDSLPTGRVLDVDPEHDFRAAKLVGTLHLDDVYVDLVPDADGLVRCILSGDTHETVVEFDGKPLPVVVPYTPPGREAVCMEPYSCPPDAFNLKTQGANDDMTVLEPGASCSWEIRMFQRPV